MKYTRLQLSCVLLSLTGYVQINPADWDISFGALQREVVDIFRVKYKLFPDYERIE